MKKFSAENMAPNEQKPHDELINKISQTYDDPNEAYTLIQKALKKFNAKDAKAFFTTEKAALKSRKEAGVKTKRTVRELRYALDPKVNFSDDRAIKLEPGGPKFGQSAKAKYLDQPLDEALDN